MSKFYADGRCGCCPRWLDSRRLQNIFAENPLPNLKILFICRSAHSGKISNHIRWFYFLRHLHLFSQNPLCRFSVRRHIFPIRNFLNIRAYDHIFIHRMNDSNSFACIFMRQSKFYHLYPFRRAEFPALSQNSNGRLYLCGTNVFSNFLI